jgi:hypothetical protein
MLLFLKRFNFEYGELMAGSPIFSTSPKNSKTAGCSVMAWLSKYIHAASASEMGSSAAQQTVWVRGTGKVSGFG